MKNRILKINILAVAACMGLFACSSSKVENKANTASITYKTATVDEQVLKKTIRLPGELKPYQQVDIYAKVSAFIKELRVDRGSKVQKGDVLAVLDAPELASQMEEANSKLKSAEAGISEKQAVYRASSENYKRLYNTSKTPGTISQNDLDAAHARMFADSMQMVAARENASSARSHYQSVTEMSQYLIVTAPFSGTITQRNVHPGALVGPVGKGTDLPMLKLEQDDKIRLVVAVPEIYTGNLLDKEVVSFSVKAYPNEKFNAVVNRTSGSLEANIRSEMVEMDVTDKRIKPGMFAEVEFSTGRPVPSMVVPRAVLVLSTERSFVIRVKDNKAEWVNVIKGNEQGDKIEIFGAINKGDKLVVNANDELKDGSRISIE